MGNISFHSYYHDSNSVLVDRNEFAQALSSLKKTTKLKNSFEIVLAYKAGILTGMALV